MVRQSFNNTNGKIIYKHKLSRFFINTNGRAIRQNDQETQMVHVKLSNKTSGMTIIHATTQMIKGDQRKKL